MDDDFLVTVNTMDEEDLVRLFSNVDQLRRWIADGDAAPIRYGLETGFLDPAVALEIAVTAANPQIVVLATAHGAELRFIGLIKAVATQNPQFVRFLFNLAREMPNYRQILSMAIMTALAFDSDERMLQQLVVHGVRGLPPDPEPWMVYDALPTLINSETLLQTAIERRNVPLLQALLRTDVDIRVRNDYYVRLAAPWNEGLRMLVATDLESFRASFDPRVWNIVDQHVRNIHEIVRLLQRERYMEPMLVYEILELMGYSKKSIQHALGSS